jgi:hypothetical protein
MRSRIRRACRADQRSVIRRLPTRRGGLRLWTNPPYELFKATRQARDPRLTSGCMPTVMSGGKGKLKKTCAEVQAVGGED